MDPILGAALISGVTSGGIGLMNYNQQKKYAGLSERLLRHQWHREDTAVQRRVSDLKAAGLSPVLAAGQPAGSGGMVSIQAPQMENQNIGNELTNYYTNKVASQNIKNMTASENLIEEQAALAKIQQNLNKANASEAWARANMARKDWKRYKGSGINPQRDIKNEGAHTIYGEAKKVLSKPKQTTKQKNYQRFYGGRWR